MYCTCTHLMFIFLMESLGMRALSRGDVNSFNLESAIHNDSNEHSGDCTRRHNCLMPANLKWVWSVIESHD